MNAFGMVRVPGNLYLCYAICFDFYSQHSEWKCEKKGRMAWNEEQKKGKW